MGPTWFGGKLDALVAVSGKLVAPSKFSKRAQICYCGTPEFNYPWSLILLSLKPLTLASMRNVLAAVVFVATRQLYFLFIQLIYLFPLCLANIIWINGSALPLSLGTEWCNMQIMMIEAHSAARAKHIWQVANVQRFDLLLCSATCSGYEDVLRTGRTGYL